MRNSTETQKRYYADSSSVAIEEMPYYQQDSYYTLVVHEGTQFRKKVIPFNERKTVTYPSKNGCMFQKFYCWNIANMESTLNLLMGIRAFGGLIMECVR